MPFEEKKRMAFNGSTKASFYEQALRRSKSFRDEFQKRRTVVHSWEMPWEKCAQGLLKHVVNEELFTREFALEIYIQVLQPGKCSGKHRHMAEEVFYVLEGRGYDLHWDLKPEIDNKYEWAWAEEPKKFEWEEGDFVYIPPFTIHQHFSADSGEPARFITATNRLVRALGFDWIDQIEDDPEYNATESKK